jgi:glycosyltransferase involved in cell wall biosynthesis
MLFSIVIPNYNSEKWIEKLLNSILEQTFTDYEVIIVDDISTDNSIDLITKTINDKRFKLIRLEEKRWNGGTRNIGVKNAQGEYILFADCDDWFNSNDCLETIAKVIEENNKPDCVRLPYSFIEIGKGDVMLHENSLEELANTVFVAPWTKCIKRELFVPFPENTLIEDVVQHIAQIDVIETLAYCPIPIMVWNRTNTDAISANNKTYDRDSKRYSSIYRNVADLLDLRCKHDYCEKRRQFRIDYYLDILHKGQESTIVRSG